MLITTLPSYMSNCKKPSRKWKHSPHQRLRDRSDTMIERLMPFSLEPGNLVLAKPNACKGKRKVKDQWEEELYNVKCWVTDGVPSYLMKNQWTGCSWVLHQNQLFLITPARGTSLCMPMQAVWARCTTTALEEQTPEGSETEEAPWSANGLPPPMMDSWDSSMLGDQEALCIPWIFCRVSLLDQGWKVQCRGTRGVWKSMSTPWQ